MEGLKVKVVYRNKNLDPTYEKTYSLQDYVAMLKADMLSLISSVEDLAYMVNDNKLQEDWSEDSWTLFQRIRHKQLDIAGAVGRLPDNLIGDDCDAETTVDH